MQNSTVLIGLLSLLLSCCATMAGQFGSQYLYGDEEDHGSVIEQTDEEDFRKDPSAKIVEFYSPYCGGCRAYKPKYIELSEQLSTEYPSIKVYAVSCVAQKEVCQEYNINGYPSLLAFPANTVEKADAQVVNPHVNQAGKVQEIAEILKMNNMHSSVQRLTQIKSKLEKTNKLSVGETNDEEEEEEEEDTTTETITTTGDTAANADEGEDEEGEDEEGEEEGDTTTGTTTTTGGNAPTANEPEDDEGEENDETQEEGGLQVESYKSEKAVTIAADKDEETDGEEEEEEGAPVVVNGGAEEDDERRVDATRDRGASLLTPPRGLPPPLLKPGRVPGAGANRAALKSKDMDKWSEFIEARRSRLAQNRLKNPLVLNKPAESGTTELMRANTPGTEEFSERRKRIMDKINTLRAKKRFGTLRSNSEPIDSLRKGSLPIQVQPLKPGFAKKQLEKIPVVKRIFKMSREEALILDASLSFVTGLKHNVFTTTDPLTDKKKTALKDWLQLVSVALPPEWGLHSLIDDLLANMEMISKSQQDLERILKKHPMPRDSWSKLCDKTGSGGFSCGMWKLFHIITVGIAEHRGGLNLIESGMVEEGSTVFSPMDAADVIREYMAHFFGCKDCRDHFIASYDQCDYRRCDRLASDEDDAGADDWKQFAMWMWELHNGVSVRVANQKVDRLQKKLNMKHLQGAQTVKLIPKKEDEIRHLWPSVEECFTCFADNGQWNEDAVFQFLERTYWDAPDAKFDRLLSLKKAEAGGGGTGLLFIMLIVAFALVGALRKHIDTASFVSTSRQAANLGAVAGGFGNRMRDSVAGKKRTA